MSQYKSKKVIEIKNAVTLKKYFCEFLNDHSFVRCKSLNNRKVFFDKQPEAILERKKSVKNRLACFWVALDILKNHRLCAERFHNGFSEYHIEGLSGDGMKVVVHLREEIQRKDRKLFLISTYYTKHVN